MTTRKAVGWALLGIGAALTYRTISRRRADLTGRVTLITGGSRGLGLALARELAQRGCRLALAARDERRLEEVRAELRRSGAEVEIFPCDVSEADQVRSLIHDVIARYGRLDILINNAGVIQVGPATEMTIEDYHEAQDTMFWGPLEAILAAMPQFRRQRSGAIINIASIGGKVSVPHLLPYNCAKFALVGLSEGLSAELARENIHVLTVAPGLLTGSHLNAQFRGKHRLELGWFGLSANAPLLAMEPSDAAVRIVDALCRRDREIILSAPAKLLARAHALAPSLSAKTMGLAARMMPGANPNNHEKLSGQSVLDRSDSALSRAVESAGRKAAAEYQ